MFKKINFKKLFFVGALAVCSLIGITNVSAATGTLTFEHSGYWWTRTNPGSSDLHSWYMENYNFGNRVAYCIEPGIPEGNPMYPADWNATGLSNDIKERIFQDKIKAFLNEDEELSPEECLFVIGLGWGCVIPGFLLIFVFKKWINFLEKIKKTLDK